MPGASAAGLAGVSRIVDTLSLNLHGRPARREREFVHNFAH